MTPQQRPGNLTSLREEQEQHHYLRINNPFSLTLLDKNPTLKPFPSPPFLFGSPPDPDPKLQMFPLSKGLVSENRAIPH